MRRFGFGVTSTSLMRLIRDVIGKRAPEFLPLAQSLGTRPLTEEQREALREALAEELVADGLGPDDEPNDYGRFIEAAIDWLGSR